MDFKNFLNNDFDFLISNIGSWMPLTKKESSDFWNNDGDLVERWGIRSPKELHKAKIKIPLNHIEKLKNYDEETVEFYNKFDIWLKNKYKMNIVDFIDYDKGEVYLIKPININFS